MSIASELGTYSIVLQELSIETKNRLLLAATETAGKPQLDKIFTAYVPRTQRFCGLIGGDWDLHQYQ